MLFVFISSEDVSVRYAVVFNGETELSDDPESLEEPDAERDEDLNAPKLKHIIVKALKQEPSLPLDIQTLNFEAGEHNLSPYLFSIKYQVVAKNLFIKACNVSFSVNTHYPVAELSINPEEGVVLEDDILQTNTEESIPTPRFFPTVAVVESSLEASTIKPETYTFVPFTPNITPEATFAISYETPSMAGVAEEYTEGTADEPSDITSAGTKVETMTEQGGETEEEVEEMLPTEPDDIVEGGPEEHVKNGEATSSIPSSIFKAGCESSTSIDKFKYSKLY